MKRALNAVRQLLPTDLADPADVYQALNEATGGGPASDKGSRFVEAFVRQVGGTLATASG